MQRHINEEDMYLHTLEEELGLKFINRRWWKELRELKSGLPSAIKGRIGMDISPTNPDFLYALVEAEIINKVFIFLIIEVKAGKK